MIIFFYEFLHFLSSSLAILVCISSAALFIITYRYERKLRTGWRAAGFLLLALAFLLFVLERKEPMFEILAVTIEAIAMFSIFKGVLAEPKLIHLRKVGEIETYAKIRKQRAKSQKKMSKTSRLLLLILLLVILASVFLVPGYLYFVSLLPSVIQLITVIIIISTIVIQYKRYKREEAESKSAHREWQNLYPLIGYIFLLVRGLALVLHRLPDLDIVVLRKMTLDYSSVWIISLIATFIAFIYLAIWAWNFVKIRVFLRTYVVFISIVIFVAAIGSLIFTFFIFRVLENNNLDLMLKGAETESIIMQDRSNTAMFVAKLISDDQRFTEQVRNNNYNLMKETMEDYLESSEADILRVYNIFGEVVVSPSDTRDEGKIFSDDSLVAFALMQRKQVRSFDMHPGVLSDFIVTRAVHPIIFRDSVIGAVEIGYKFDNAFVDFSKEKANLDVTIYTGRKISATTIKTQDEVSRFVGSEETRLDIITNVLQDGEAYTTIVDRFGEKYYSAFNPIRDVNGVIIGMVSVGVPTYFLTETTRQNLLSTFIIVAGLSALVSLIGYYAMPRLRKVLGPADEKSSEQKK